jgi:hypothetical protein
MNPVLCRTVAAQCVLCHVLSCDTLKQAFECICTSNCVTWTYCGSPVVRRCVCVCQYTLFPPAVCMNGVSTVTFAQLVEHDLCAVYEHVTNQTAFFEAACTVLYSKTATYV